MTVLRTQVALITAILLIMAPTSLDAQTTHTVMVNDNFFDPDQLTIEAGDTVRWVDPPGGMEHNVMSQNFLWSPTTVSNDGWEFEFTFENEGEYGFICGPHALEGMDGTVTVTAGSGGGGGVDLNPGHNGNWWNGPARSGEGVQLELADAGGGQLVFVATIYSYGPGGGQIFLIAVGTPVGDTVEVDVFITDGPVWGDGFDPNDVNEVPWGTGVFTSQGCDLVSMTLTPNAAMQALGFTILFYDLVRLTTPAILCPYQ